MAVSGCFIGPNQSIFQHLKSPRPNPSYRNQSCLRASLINSSDGKGGKMIWKEKDEWKINFSGEKPTTPLLGTINYPAHMKNLSTQDLEQLAAELRADIVYKVSKIGGHLSSSLGVVELSVALHHVFNTPEDKIIWDVGHQLSAGHSSTSISAGLGMAVARDLLGKKNNVISVVGDGAMTAGQAYEAMNNAGYLDFNLIVVLNDKKQVSLPTATLDGPATPVGALSSALAKLQASTNFHKLREAAKSITKQIGGQAHQGMISASGSTLFEEIGLYYIGPVEGHNVEDLVTIFQKIKAMPAPGPVLIHIVTEKGKGYPPAEAAPDKMHWVVKFDPKTGQQFKTKSTTLTYTQYFAESLIKEAEADNKIVAIHAAMGGGTGLNYFQKKFPNCCFDVGIAEQHAVTFAAGLATEDLKPFCAIYSSFLQRGYDQVVHDVDLQKLPVRFTMDRAGLVGADGATHCGAFDITYMACLPNIVVMAPCDEAELMHMVATAAVIDDRPSCFKFPRGNGIGAVLLLNNKGTPLEIGKGRILLEGCRVALLGYGSVVQQCLQAANILKSIDISVTVADEDFQLANEHEILITVEEGSIGGFGSHVSHYLSLTGILDGPL
ncbi:hypothetical protein ACB094_02G138400 [Castanea mollissima]